MDRPRCRSCGRLMKIEPGAAWMMIYDGAPPTPHGEVHRCKSCVSALGPFKPQTGIRPEHSCGIYEVAK